MSQLAITTTQNVTINFTAASVGDRLLGQLLDTLVKAAYIIAVYFVINVFDLDRFFRGMDQWSIMGIFSIIGLPIMFYSLIQESLWEGQTIAKKLLKMKVIKIDGYQAGFGDYLVRWLFRLIEVLIGSGVIGLIAIVTSNKNQRLGDMAAGTAVISLKNNININHTILQEVNNDYVPVYPLVIKLSDNDVRIIKETFETAIKTRDYATLIKLREKVIAVTGIKNQSGNDQDFIRTLMKDYNYYTQNM
ncbi:transporter [Flavobacterium sp. 316]|uniref:RDD family protein n=1 Tax=Flavobacterium sediminilitoris TaxID=2024526 RepID=A0ABY4HJC1_9FLAO|nr:MULTISPECIES: RDD family protein [Flavobacterium]KIX22328.1 transporter [Flavobacterium sp. 316]UOX32751.1 RDD family protein [Flavobacterium sediminilitoris]